MIEFPNDFQAVNEPVASTCDARDAHAEMPTAAFVDPRFADRLRQVHDHRVYKQDNPNPRTAALRGICNDLMDLEAHLAEAVRGGIVSTGMTLQNLSEYSPAIDLMVRLTKQITQVTQIEMRSAKIDA